MGPHGLTTPNRILVCGAIALFLVLGRAGGFVASAEEAATLILVYHRFGPTVADAMTVTTSTLEWQLGYLADHACAVGSLRSLVECRRGTARCTRPPAVVVTVDDGHRSVYSDLLPVVKRFGVPVTLFIYPSAVSRADYALTWDQLRELEQSGLFEIQSHSYWHPNFKQEKRRLGADAYRRFVADQLLKSRTIIAREIGAPVDLLSWPFGIHDRELEEQAVAAGYVAAVTLEGRPARPRDDLMALPRHLVSEHDRNAVFARLLAEVCP